MENILMTDELFISLGFTKTQASTEHTVYWEHSNYFTNTWRASANEKLYLSLIANPFKGNMFVDTKRNLDGFPYATKLQIRLYTSAEPYLLLDVINGMNWFFEANNIEKGKEDIRTNIKMILKIDE